MSGFAYVITACFEDLVFTHINFSVTWENRNQQGRSVVPFLQSKALMEYLLVLSQQILLRQMNWGNASNQALTQLLSIDCSASYSGANSVSFNRALCIPRYPQQSGAGNCSSPPNKTRDHQSVWEVWESGETLSIRLDSEEVDGHRGPLLTPRLRLFLELRQRRGVCSRVLCCHQNCWLKNTHNMTVESYFICWEC